MFLTVLKIPSATELRFLYAGPLLWRKQKAKDEEVRSLFSERFKDKDDRGLTRSIEVRVVRWGAGGLLMRPFLTLT